MMLTDRIKDTQRRAQVYTVSKSEESLSTKTETEWHDAA